jgi:hypothetical protein
MGAPFVGNRGETAAAAQPVASIGVDNAAHSIPSIALP